MKLNVKALMVVGATLWGGGVMIVALLHGAIPSYGEAFLSVIGSVYPGAGPDGLTAGLTAALWATLDGAVCGGFIGWIYNRLA